MPVLFNTSATESIKAKTPVECVELIRQQHLIGPAWKRLIEFREFAFAFATPLILLYGLCAVVYSIDQYTVQNNHLMNRALAHADDPVTNSYIVRAMCHYRSVIRMYSIIPEREVTTTAGNFM